MSGKTDCLVVDAFHQITVAGDHEGAMVDELIAIDRVQMALGDRHPDRHRYSLSQRAGCDLDARKLEILRVTGGWAAQLPKVLDVVERGPLVSGEIEQGIDQHRAM